MTSNDRKRQPMWQLNEAVMRKVYGWHTGWYSDALGEGLYIVDTRATPDGLYHLLGGQWLILKNEHGALEQFYGRLAEAPAHNIQHAFNMEEELARQGHQEAYASALMLIVGITPCGDTMALVGPYDAFRVAHATPEQRVRAALKVKEGSNETHTS